MIISIMAAKARNNVIGFKGRLPWHLPKDLKFLKNTTKGHFILMGRKTFQSLDAMLPGRTTIIISRNPEYFAEGSLKFTRLEDAIKLGEEHGQKELFILGGGQIYQESLKWVDKMYITEVHAEFEGDAFFPPINTDLWVETWREDHKADESHAYDYSFVIYERRTNQYSM